ncbi:hypothetical protein PHSY_002277 [Pseudozyma hubeiensis SY62]|uniref:Uncharacterized protein n=1 Tax=Pseudozyma hubeiensis (strain SY62) TaxID=1305764 RepID=R9P0Q6_PSEHS|nr:hypothetical protein PHSY_002277 [Pseudozyma hubeiensis SY62]GAC94704.1 hypothetical protein PHSY_002277 [Pseudozyma hubeiensis SY62]
MWRGRDGERDRREGGSPQRDGGRIAACNCVSIRVWLKKRKRERKRYIYGIVQLDQQHRFYHQHYPVHLPHRQRTIYRLSGRHGSCSCSWRRIRCSGNCGIRSQRQSHCERCSDAGRTVCGCFGKHPGDGCWSLGFALSSDRCDAWLDVMGRLADC